MFQNDKPATDLYGQGKGFAQVLDLTPMRENAKLAEMRAQRQEQEKQREDAHQQAMMEADLKALKDSSRVADQQDIADKVKDYTSTVNQTFAKAKNGKLSIDDEIALQSKLRDVNSYITQSNQVGQKQIAMMSDYKRNGGSGGHWGGEDFEKSIDMPISKMKGSYLDYQPMLKYDISKDWNANVKPLLKGNGGITPDETYSDNFGNIHYKESQVANPELVQQENLSNYQRNGKVQAETFATYNDLKNRGVDKLASGKSLDDYMVAKGTPQEHIDLPNFYANELAPKLAPVQKEIIKTPPAANGYNSGINKRLQDQTLVEEADGYKPHFGSENKFISVSSDELPGIIKTGETRQVRVVKIPKAGDENPSMTIEVQKTDEENKQLEKVYKDKTAEFDKKAKDARIPEIEGYLDGYKATIADPNASKSDKEEAAKQLAPLQTRVDAFYAKNKKPAEPDYSVETKNITKGADESYDDWYKKANSLFASVHGYKLSDAMNGKPPKGVYFDNSKIKSSSSGAPMTYKLTKDYNGATYGRNSEKDNWVKIK